MRSGKENKALAQHSMGKKQQHGLKAAVGPKHAAALGRSSKQLFLDLGQVSYGSCCQTRALNISLGASAGWYCCRVHCKCLAFCSLQLLITSYTAFQATHRQVEIPAATPLACHSSLQRDFSASKCAVCGMVYAKGHEEDEKLHRSFHSSAVQGLRFQVRRATTVSSSSCIPPVVCSEMCYRLPAILWIRHVAAAATPVL
jgi:hypothetical protein